MSVERRVIGSKRRYVARWREDGRQRSRTFDRKADAADFEADARRRSQLGAHTPVAPSRERLGDWLRRWWAREAIDWAASTRMHRASILDKWIEPYLSGVKLRDLGPARVRDWRTQIVADGCSKAQSNQALRVLSSALGAAVRDGLLPANPCTGVAKFRLGAKRPRAMSALEVERIRAELPTLRDVVMLGLLAYAGLRTEEVLALRWRDVGPVLVIDEAWTHGELKPTKTYQRRTVEIVRPLADDLALLRPKVDDLSALVCPSETGGYLHLGNWRNRVWKPACARAGVIATPYDGRHTYASLLIHEGRSPVLVADALGHASGETVWRYYAHLFDGARAAGSPATMVESIEAARSALLGQGVYSLCTRDPVRVLRAVSALGVK